MRPTHKYIPTNGFYISKRIGQADVNEFDPNRRQPVNVYAPNQPEQQNFNNPPPQQPGPPSRQNFGSVLPSPREVSETDLYLLGAIEKLVYRVDYMEKRLHRSEQLIYYLMAGNKQKEGLFLNKLPFNILTKIY